MVIFATIVVALAEGNGYEDEDSYAHTPAHYTFEYGVASPLTGDVKAQREHREGHLVDGEYALRESDGTTRLVQYKSTPHAGFEAIVQRAGVAVHPALGAVQGIGGQGFGDQGFGGKGVGGQGFGDQGFGGKGLGSQGFGSQGLVSQGLVSQGLGSQGLTGHGFGNKIGGQGLAGHGFGGKVYGGHVYGGHEYGGYKIGGQGITSHGLGGQGLGFQALGGQGFGDIFGGLGNSYVGTTAWRNQGPEHGQGYGHGKEHGY